MQMQAGNIFAPGFQRAAGACGALAGPDYAAGLSWGILNYVWKFSLAGGQKSGLNEAYVAVPWLCSKIWRVAVRCAALSGSKADHHAGDEMFCTW